MADSADSWFEAAIAYALSMLGLGDLQLKEE